MLKPAVVVVAVALLSIGCHDSRSQTQAVSGQSAQSPRSRDSASYMGRSLAPTMSHLGAGWLVRDERESEEATSKMLAALNLQPGQVACDVGAGNGYHTLMMARLVAPSGTAIGVDLQPEMLTALLARAEAANITNLEVVQSDEQDPKLDAGRCDLILLADVYHEFSQPAAMLAKLKRALKPNGVIALLEFRGEDPLVPIKPEHKMTKAQILKEYQANGWRLARSVDTLPWQHLMFFVPSATP